MAAGAAECAACGKQVGIAPSQSASVPIPYPVDDAVTFLGDRSDKDRASSRVGGDRAGKRPPSRSRLAVAENTGPLGPGTEFGARYHIIRLLGMGGMGAVYQAWDEELGVSVALKTIRPEVTADQAGARDLERRFKRELLLARQVTHKNVVRIHDLGEIDGIKYLTMPYIQGSDLAHVIAQHSKLPVTRAVGIAKQVVSGLVAAHEAGVIHRDLKPANIMLDADDRAVIMDFGIARSTSGGATLTGAVVGTLEYMAPEQALAHAVDHRADIYAFGLILRDMIVGFRHATRAESAVAELMARVQHPLPPMRSIDPAIPEALEHIVNRCTQPDAAVRYQLTSELAHDLDQLDAVGQAAHGGGFTPVPKSRSGIAVAMPQPAAKRLPVRLAVAVVLILAAAAGGWMLRDRLFSPGAADGGRTVTLAVMPFRNATGDINLDWLGQSLADMVRGDIGESARLRIVPSDRVFQLVRDLRIESNSELDSGTARSVMEFSSADRLVSGSFGKIGDQFRIEVRLQDERSAATTVAATASDENDLIRAAQDLARQIRNNLNLDSAAVSELEARVFRPSSQSVPALRYYSEGQQLTRLGEHQQAARRFEASVQADPNFALAHASLARSLSLTGKAADAERASRRAVALSDKLPADEREMIAAAHAAITNDINAGIAAYEHLVASHPTDVQLRFSLAGLLENKGALDRASEEYGKILEWDPKYVDTLLAASRVAIRRRDFQKSLEWLTTAQTLSVQLDNQQAKATTLHYLGIAYRFLGKLDDAMRNYQESLAIKRQIGDKRGVAASLNEIAQIHDLKGRPTEAWPNFLESIAIRRELGDRRGLGNDFNNLGASYLNNGKFAEALAAFQEAQQIHRDFGDEESQARGLSNIGNVYLAQGRYEDARTYLERALELREKLKVPANIAITLTGLADVSTKLGEFERAQQQYVRALELARSAGDKRSVGFVSHEMGKLLEQQGRYGAALEAKSEAVKIFRGLQERSPRFAEVLVGYGYTLSLAGRTDEAGPPIEEGLSLARELNNQGLIAHALNVKGDNTFHRGDLKTARTLFEQAQQVALTTGNTYSTLVSQTNVAKVAAHDGRTAMAVTEVTRTLRQVDSLALRPLSAECSLYLGIALMNAGRSAEATKVLETAIPKSEALGLRPVLAQTHHLLAQALKASQRAADAGAHEQQAAQILEQMTKDGGADSLLNRFDLRPLQQAGPR